MASSRFLTSASPLMKLLHSKLSPTVATPFSIRSLRTISVCDSDTDYETKSDSDSHSDSDSDAGAKGHIHKSCPLENRFLVDGPHAPYVVMEDDEGKHARLDMPGIGKKGLKLWVEDDSLWIDGVETEDEKVALSENVAPRKFYGEIDVEEDLYKVDEIKAKLKNGVLNLMIPKVPLEERKDVSIVKVN